MAKIVFLDEYSLGNSDLSAIKSLGEYIGYDRTLPEQVVERCQGATVVITNKLMEAAISFHSFFASGKSLESTCFLEEHFEQVREPRG